LRILIHELANGRADVDTVAVYVDEELLALARESETLCDLELVAATKATASYTLGATQPRLLTAFYDDRELSRAPIATLELSKNWRDRQGFPVCFTQEDESEGTYVLFPKPDRPSKDFIFLWGEPLGRDFPGYSLGILFSVMPNEDYSILDWVGFIIAWRVLAREFGRVSDHQDVEFSDACKLYAKLLSQMSGL
jgi:hypothetical protein